MARQKWFVETGIQFPPEFFITAHKLLDWTTRSQECAWEADMLRKLYDRVRIECQLAWPGLQTWVEAETKVSCEQYVAYDARRRSLMFVSACTDWTKTLVISRAPFGAAPFVIEIANSPTIDLPIAVREVA